MSKCISVHGEYSEHEYTSKPICDYCGQISEMLAIVQNEDFRTALVAIQELHKKAFVYTTEAGDCEHGDECEGIELEQGLYCPDHKDGVTCQECAEITQRYGTWDEPPEWPCDTRRLADQGLGDKLARTTRNGENNA